MKSIQQAYTIVKKKLESGDWPAGTRMPPLAQLAKISSVSRTTMWRALSLLQKESLLYAKKRGRIIAGPLGKISITPPQKNPEARGPLWKRLTGVIGTDILSGSFPDIALPPVTKLAAKYGVTTPTLYKTLGQLVEDGLLSMEGRKYNQGRGGLRMHQPTVVFITAADINGNIDVGELRSHVLIQAFEQDAPRMRLDSYCEGFNFRSANGFIEATAAIKTLKEVSGFIVNIWNPWDTTMCQRWIDLLMFLSQRNVPVIVIDQAGNFDFPKPLLRAGNVRIFRISSLQAGMRAAEALHRRGHSRIAFISPDAGTEWGKARYEGLCRYFGQYGGKDADVKQYSLDMSASNFELIFALLKLDEQGIHALHFEQFSEERIRSMYPLLKRVKEMRLDSIMADNTIAGTLAPIIEVMKGYEGREHDSQTLIRLQGLVGNVASDQGQALWLAPLFKNILATHEATAWICSSDQIALAALSFLRTNKIKVPEEISVMGFDNWPGAYEQQLSTFDFNMHGIVHEALLMIINEKTLKSKPVISEVDGYVVERRTTRR